MRLWHRYIQWRAHGRDAAVPDAGISLLEIMVAIILLSVGLLGLLGEIATDVKQQGLEQTQVTANHLADSWFEFAESLTHGKDATTGAALTETSGGAVAASYATITQGPANKTPTIKNITYTETTNYQICSAAAIAGTSPNPPVFTLASCGAANTGTPGSTDTVYSTIKIVWSIGNHSHQLTQTRNLADNSIYQPPNTNGSGLSSCNRTGLSTTTSSLKVLNGATVMTTDNTHRVDLDTTNTFHPAKDLVGATLTTITVQLDETGLNKATCIPLTWQDRPGGLVTSPLVTHQIDLHTDSAPSTCTTTTLCRYTANIPSSSITIPVGTPSWDGDTTFTAALIDASSGVTAVTATNKFFVNAPPTLSCTIPVIGLLALNTIETHNNLLPPHPPATIYLLPVIVNCTTTNTVQTDQVTLQYKNAAGTLVTANLASPAPGTTWTLTLPVGTSMFLGNQPFFFNATRAPDSRSAPQITINVTDINFNL